mmetsp:Transcript_102794/g.209493  ORF Transcript_102794/g.209493 Transcript_102794/m.209493 type:complete len:706 (+) Transcript_102794:97-2214(+)
MTTIAEATGQLPAPALVQDTTLQLSVAVGGALPAEDIDVLVTVTPPAGSSRVASDICCVIDVSGSMGAGAVIKSASLGSGSEESSGLSMLDVAKHGVKTVIKTLNAHDRLSLVSFNQEAVEVLPLTVMDEGGQKKAMAAVERLVVGGGTNIWNGLHTGLETLRTGTCSGRASLGHVMLLTDGQTRDREVTLPNLEAYRNSWERLPGTISTFGFGYNIDSELLCWLASAGEATYSFIPDPGFVGTVFINTMSNILVTMAREAHLDLEPEEGAEILAVKGGLTSLSTGSGVRVNLGTLQYGQSRDVIIRMKIPASVPGEAFVVGKVQYEIAAGVKQDSNTIEASANYVESDMCKVEPHAHRASFVEALKAVMDSRNDRCGSLQTAQAEMRRLAELVAMSQSAGQEFVQALLEDIKGQSTMALSSDEWFQRWGQHYLPSIMFAHKVQQCNNFKDPSVQLYGGELFKGIQQQADELFNTLPAPTPSRTSQISCSLWGASAILTASAPAAPQVSMAAFNDRCAGCINGTSLVSKACGAVCQLRDLIKGDKVLALGGTIAEVVCLVRTSFANGRAMLVSLPGGAQVTAHHPVYLDGAWRFPVDVAKPEDCACEAVYSVVLNGAPALMVGGMPCVALGHGLQEGAARHAFFGTTRVLDDLQDAPGFENGLVELQPSQVVRDPETGLVSAFDFGSHRQQLKKSLVCTESLAAP